MSGEDGAPFKSVSDLPSEAKEPLADLLLILADNKRLLGLRYADWILGAPALEAGISCSAMAQDEWGHGRILYAMLRDFGGDPARLEHERDPSDYRNMELLDRPADNWPGLLALNLLVDTALTVQFEALSESRFEPVHYKVSKLLDEERFHFEHARGWTARLGATDRGREALAAAFAGPWEACLRWFGPDEDALGIALARAGIARLTPDGLRERWLQRVGPIVHEAGIDLAERADGTWSSHETASWDGDGWASSRRRTARDSGPDADTLARARGDRNRALLLD